jgi:hypothetical protein
MNIKYRKSNIKCRIVDFSSRHFAFSAGLFCSCVLTAFLIGCESPDAKRNSLTDQIDTLKKDNKQLTGQIEHLESKTKGLEKQIDTLHSLSGEINLQELYDVQKIKITKHTNLHDKDKDEEGKKETLIVHIQPIDGDGDIVKAAGSVDVQLLDLNEDEPKVLGGWHVGPRELRKLWFNALMMTNYRLKFDVSDKIKTFEEPLTVKVTFTDYLTGRVFKEQKVIEPQTK